MLAFDRPCRGAGKVLIVDMDGLHCVSGLSGE
jgi:hypothetical protein